MAFHNPYAPDLIRGLCLHALTPPRVPDSTRALDPQTSTSPDQIQNT